MSFEEISSANPETIVLMPCGFDVRRTITEYENVLKSYWKIYHEGIFHLKVSPARRV